MKRFVLLPVFGLFHSLNTFGQCAMCRSTLENNISNGDIGIAAGINTGILYLLSLPYLAVMVLGYLWYRNSRRNILADAGS
jgi:hypothetical protein